MRFCAALLVLVALGAAPAERYARITVIQPREGMQREFEEGYRRHLEWHRAHNDPWSWIGWSVTTGERFGTFIDGTFDHAAADFDNAVAPAEDAADNAKNVLPYGRIDSTAFYRVCGGSTDALNARFVSLRTIRGREPVVPANALCLELVNGGDAPAFLLFVPATKISEAIAQPHGMGTIELLRLRDELTYRP